MPTISVIVPVYNIEEEIAKCLLSILLQRFVDFEIIVVDDGSTDQSPKILDEFAEKYSQIKVFHTKNHGLSAARNYGLKKAHGKYIAFIDGDDYVDPNFLSKLYQSIIDNSSDMSVCGYTEFSDRKIKDYCPRPEVLSGFDVTKRLLTHQENLDIVSWNKLYKKSLFKTVQFPVGLNHEDNYTTYKLLYQCERVSFINLPLYNYVRRKKSITKKEPTISRLNAKLKATKEAKRYFKDNLELLPAAEFAEVLSFYQFIDFALKDEIPKNNFKKYRKKVLDAKISLDQKRRLYKRLLSPLGGIPYIIFRKLVK
ncbi:glycosyltransferase [Candidatus Saccharibacteria bacterium]|nr:glycosyltransferase [Candidatus Saccharibacteria bacterium]